MKIPKAFIPLAVFSTFFFSLGAHAFTLSNPAFVKAWRGQTITFHVNPANCPSNMSALVDQAIELWSSVPTAYVKLSHGSDSATTGAQLKAQQAAFSSATGPEGDPVIICDTAFSADSGLSGNGASGAGFSQFSDISGLGEYHITFGGIWLNYESGTAGNQSLATVSDTFRTIAIAHEMGHVLGLGHSNEPNAIMSYSHNATEIKLGSDDVNGLTYLYPRGEGAGDKVFGCGTLEAIVDKRGPRPPSSGAQAEVAGFFGLCFVFKYLAKYLLKFRREPA